MIYGDWAMAIGQLVTIAVMIALVIGIAMSKTTYGDAPVKKRKSRPKIKRGRYIRYGDERIYVR